MSRLGPEWHDCVHCRSLTLWTGAGDALDDTCSTCGLLALTHFSIMLARDCELFDVDGRFHIGTNMRLAALGHGTAYTTARCGQSVGETSFRDASFTAVDRLCPHCLAQQFGRAKEKTVVGDKYAHRRRR
jgi:hypothetical protein